MNEWLVSILITLGIVALFALFVLSVMFVPWLVIILVCLLAFSFAVLIVHSVRHPCDDCYDL